MAFSRRGRPLAEEEKSTDAAKARARAMELLAGQELSSGQLYERLGRRFTQPTAAAVVAEMVERQYVDDERYALTRAHGLLAARKSRRAAAQNLRQKGLDTQQISAALEEVYAPDEAGEDPELEAAAALVEGRYRGKLAAGRKDLVVAALARRGFAYPAMTPQGVLALVKMMKYSLEDLLEQEKPLFLVLENLQDPGNLGTILRTGEGAGINGVIMSHDTVDIYNPKVTRSTMGSIFRVPFVYVDDLLEVAETMKQKNIITYAAHLNGTDYTKEDYQKGTAFFIGNEGNGLTDKLTDKVQKKIKIPMCGKVESLNAAMASGLLVYEARRQRQGVD